MSFSSARAHRVLKRRVAVWTALAFTPALHAQTLPATAVPTNAPTAAPTATPSQAASRGVATLPAISVSADAPSATLLEPASTGTLLGLTPFDLSLIHI